MLRLLLFVALFAIPGNSAAKRNVVMRVLGEVDGKVWMEPMRKPLLVFSSDKAVFPGKGTVLICSVKENTPVLSCDDGARYTLIRVSLD